MSFPFQYLPHASKRINKLLEGDKKKHGAPPPHGEYWQEYSIRKENAEEARRLSEDYMHVIGLVGVRGYLMRKLRQTKLEERILDVVTTTTRGDLDAYDDDIARGTIDRPSYQDDPHLQTSQAKLFAGYIIKNTIQLS